MFLPDYAASNPRPWFRAAALGALLSLSIAAAFAGPKVDSARAAWKQGDLLTALEQLRAVRTEETEEIDSFLAEAEICLELRYVNLARYNLERASDLLAGDDPRQSAFKDLQQRAATTEAADIGHAGTPLSARLAPSVDALRDHDPAEARAAFARAALQFETFDRAYDFGVLEARVLYPARAALLEERALYDEASADYRLSLKLLSPSLQEERRKILSRWAAMLASIPPPAAGTPAYDEYVSVLRQDTSGAGAAQLRRHAAEEALARYDTSHDLADLVSAKVEGEIARVMSAKPLEESHRTRFVAAVARLDARDRAELGRRSRARLAEQVLALPVADLPWETAERTDRLLEEVVRADPTNLAAWSRRAETPRSDPDRRALAFIVAQFKAGAPSADETIEDSQRQIRKRPYEADGYIAALEDLHAQTVDDEGRQRGELYLRIAQLLAPDSLELRRITIEHREWLTSGGGVASLLYTRMPLAAEHLLDVAPRDPRLRMWTLRYLEAYGTVKGYDDIKPRLDRVLAENPDYLPALQRRADSAWEWGKWDAALEDYRRLYELQRSNPQAVASYGQRLFWRHDFRGAAEVFGSYSAPTIAGTQSHVLQALALTGAGDEASESVMRAAMNDAVTFEQCSVFLKEIPDSPLKTCVVQAIKDGASKPGPKS